MVERFQHSGPEAVVHFDGQVLYPQAQERWGPYRGLLVRLLEGEVPLWIRGVTEYRNRLYGNFLRDLNRRLWAIDPNFPGVGVHAEGLYFVPPFPSAENPLQSIPLSKGVAFRPINNEIRVDPSPQHPDGLSLELTYREAKLFLALLVRGNSLGADFESLRGYLFLTDEVVFNVTVSQLNRKLKQADPRFHIVRRFETRGAYGMYQQNDRLRLRPASQQLIPSPQNPFVILRDSVSFDVSESLRCVISLVTNHSLLYYK